MAEVFTIGRLRARHWTVDDAEAAYDIYRRPEVVRYLGRPTPHATVDATRQRMQEIVESYDDSGYGFWALDELATGRLVGAVLLRPFPEAEEVEVGWHLHPDVWGRGYATEAATGAMQRGFDVHGLATVYAVVRPENEPSLAVARRLGMRHLGRTDRFYGMELDLFALDRPASSAH